MIMIATTIAITMMMIIIMITLIIMMIRQGDSIATAAVGGSVAVPEPGRAGGKAEHVVSRNSHSHVKQIMINSNNDNND